MYHIFKFPKKLEVKVNISVSLWGLGCCGFGQKILNNYEKIFLAINETNKISITITSFSILVS